MKQFPANYGAWNNADNVFRYINDYATNRTPKIKKGAGKDEWAAWHTYYERAEYGAQSSSC